MTKNAALKLALEALEKWDARGRLRVIAAVKKALAQPSDSVEQEPWCVEMNGCKTKCADCPDKPEQEPVATVIKKGADREWMSERLGALPDGIYSLHLAPPKRKWVGLTDDDLVACSEAQKATVIYFLAKLKKKNT